MALGEGQLRTRFNRAFPERIGQHDFGGVETAIGAGLAADEIVGDLTLLNVLAVGIGAACHVVEVEVDAQLAHLAVVIGVGEQAEGFRLVAGLMGVEMVYQHIILQHIFVVDNLVGAAEIVCQVGTHTQGMIVRQLPVHASRVGQLVVLPRHRVGTILAEHLARLGDVLDSAVLAVVLMEIVHGAEDIDAVLTVVGTQLHLRTFEVVA